MNEVNGEESRMARVRNAVSLHIARTREHRKSGVLRKTRIGLGKLALIENAAARVLVCARMRTLFAQADGRLRDGFFGHFSPNPSVPRVVERVSYDRAGGRHRSFFGLESGYSIRSPVSTRFRRGLRPPSAFHWRDRSTTMTACRS